MNKPSHGPRGVEAEDGRLNLRDYLPLQELMRPIG
jgi:hypothetical protein